MIKAGEYMLIKTTTKDDVFGDVIWRCDAVNVPLPDGKKTGLKFTMMGGTGPSARQGLVVVDSEKNIEANLKSGIAKIMPKANAEAYAKQCLNDKTNTVAGIEM